MADHVNLDTKERLFKEFSHFAVGEARADRIFTHRQRGNYVGAIVWPLMHPIRIPWYGDPRAL